MTLEEFDRELEKRPIEPLIVRLKWKYKWEKEYTYSNEILDYEDDHYVWLNDWDEGQDEVYVVGFIPIADIEVPEYKGGGIE